MAAQALKLPAHSHWEPPAWGTVSGVFLGSAYLLSVVLYYLDPTQTVKYAYYGLPALGLIGSVSQLIKVARRGEDLTRLLYVVSGLVFLNLIGLLLRGTLYVKFAQEGFLLVGSLFFAITLIGNHARHIPFLLSLSLFVLAGVYVLQPGIVLAGLLSSPAELLTGFLSSVVTSESSLSFYFALLGFYFFVQKDLLKTLLAVGLMVISFKRIAIGGFVVAAGVYSLLNLVQIGYHRRLYSGLLTAFNLGYVWVLTQLVAGTYDELIKDLFGVSPNFLLMGRVSMYSKVFADLGNFSIFGIGIGRVSDYLWRLVGSDTKDPHAGILTNLHSDILKYYLELGAVSFLIFWYFFVYYLSRDRASFCALLLLNVMLLTDNVSIYFGFMVLFFLISHCLAHPQQIPSPGLIWSKHRTKKESD